MDFGGRSLGRACVTLVNDFTSLQLNFPVCKETPLNQPARLRLINNTSLETDYGRHGASKGAADCKCVMKTQFRLGRRAFFSLTIGLWIHRRGQHNPTSAVFIIRPGDPQPLWLWYILTDQVNRLVWNSRSQSILLQGIWGQRNDSSPPNSYCKSIVSFVEVFVSILVIIIYHDIFPGWVLSSKSCFSLKKKITDFR